MNTFFNGTDSLTDDKPREFYNPDEYIATRLPDIIRALESIASSLERLADKLDHPIQVRDSY